MGSGEVNGLWAGVALKSVIVGTLVSAHVFFFLVLGAGYMGVFSL